jgi:hypothetical protein
MEMKQTISEQSLLELDTKAEDILNLEFPSGCYSSVDFHSKFATDICLLSRSSDNVNLLIQVIMEKIRRRAEIILEIIYQGEGGIDAPKVRLLF